MAQEGQTEKATPEKRKKERKEGNVAKSAELNTFFTLLALLIFLMTSGRWLVEQLSNLSLFSLSMITENMEMKDYFLVLGKKTFAIILPIGFIFMFFMALNHIIQTRGFFSWKVLKPNMKKMNPMGYPKKVFNRRTLVQIIKSFIVLGVIGYTTYFVFLKDINQIASAILLPIDESVETMWLIVLDVIKRIVAVILFIGAADYFYQWFETEDKMKMAKHEVKEEYKQHNVDQHVSGKIREDMIDAFRKGTSKKTEEASFILANPTHFSVAIRYKEGDDLPIVVAKGVDFMALYIREVAKTNNIPIEVNAPVARELYNRVQEGEYIPEDMFKAIAIIMRKLRFDGKLKT